MQHDYGGVIWTDHAIERLYQRRIAQSDAWYTFQHADKTTKGKTPGSWKFAKTYSQQKIEVIAKKNEKGEWVVLSCWSRMPGDGRPVFPQKDSYLWSLLKWIYKRFKKGENGSKSS